MVSSSEILKIPRKDFGRPRVTTYELLKFRKPVRPRTAPGIAQRFGKCHAAIRVTGGSMP